MKTLMYIFLTAAMLSALQAAGQTNGSEFNMRTTKFDDRIIGQSADGRFFSTTCKWHPRVGMSGFYSYYSAKMLFPNTNGDIVLTQIGKYNELEYSVPVHMTTKAANAQCANPYGQFNYRFVEENGVKKVDLVDYVASAKPQMERPALGQTYQVRTGLVDNGQNIVAAVTNDGRFYAIACSHGIVRSSTADFIYPNWSGKIVVKDYNNFIFGEPGLSDRAQWMSMTTKAMDAICNHPNGLYTLQVRGQEGDLSLELVGAQGVEADAHTRGRDF